MSKGFAKAEPRIEQHALPPDTGTRTGRKPLLQKVLDLGGHVFVMRIGLHRTRLSLHVHQTHRHTGRRGRLERTRLAQGTYVVDQRCARCRRGSHDLGLAGIDRNRQVDATTDRFDNRDHPVELLLFGNRIGSGPGRLAADIDQGSPGVCQGFGVTYRGVTVGKSAAVGERIGSNVQHAHDSRRCKTQIIQPEQHRNDTGLFV